MEPRQRIVELDLVKTFIILVSMIGIHTMYDLADLEMKGAASVLNILADAWGAPVFMFCMGVTLGYTRSQDANDRFRRGVRLITVGMLLNVLRYGPLAFTAYATGNPALMKGLAQIFNVDILQFAGLAFVLQGLCQKMKMNGWSILALSVVMNIAGTWLAGHYTSNYVVNQVLGYFYHTPTCSCFPLFNWFIFVAAGNVFRLVYKESDRVGKTFRYIIPVCGVIAVVHQYLSITGGVSFFKTLQSDWAFYDMATPDALCIAFGVAPFMVGLFRLISKFIPERWIGVFSYPSRNINRYYCVSWVWIMWIACFLYFIPPATTFAAFVLRWLIVIVLTTVSVVVYNKCLRKKTEEFFRKKAAVWYLGVWIVVVVFGIWYFNNVPEPYIMPY